MQSSSKLPVERLIYRRSIREILSDLAKPIPDRLLATRKQGNQVLTYVPWHYACRLLDLYAPGWEGSIRGIQQVGNLVVVVYAITIHSEEGAFTREATGQESLDGKNFGDAVCNAEAQAFKRAAAKFGLGLDLYESD
jgi:hypothetical protein